MTGGRDTGSSVAGGLAHHIPVLAGQVVHYLAPRDGGVYLDATFGAGGHTRRLLEAAACRVVALDRDPEAAAAGRALVAQAQGRLTLVQERFSAAEQVLAGLGIEGVDGALVDLGVSSMQLDQAERGFSFRLDGPLDMRMGKSRWSAADVVAAASERDLATIIGRLGEERFARSVARAVAQRRAAAPIRSTRELAEIVERVVRSRPGEIHPATRTFQALRLFVNQELEELAAALQAAERLLKPGGRLAVIAFHSLEDRIVKRFLTARSRPRAVSRHQPVAAAAPPSFRLLTAKAVAPDMAEIARNPRARSAKLRAAERTQAEPMRIAVDALPGVPALADVMRAY